ncbi:hypothetical protein OBBRIDRAFT_782465 [Obba rivulosa]|uniref:HORMA domain-containing protein n=1 Tax=Obba rivulosa TaxID=1052685 RepID=A0A8E2ARN6_9APHY|nr:hypothetical protein OBBRIDRAFT_782465 [Obba rivulosa]
MTVTRGFTEEADRLLDYLEHGIFDAVEKQYLRSFIFAVYLDNQDPNNIVEAYTFNFNAMPGTEIAVPTMSLGDDLMKMSLGEKSDNDPISKANKTGRVPTLGEALVKNLIQATTQMDALPKRRFATFKLFYYDHTPEDYEPAHFRPGNVMKDKWFFTTHNNGEAPERCSVGSVQTGYHGVDVRVASVSGYLPSTEDNNAPFLGTTQRNGFTVPTLTPMEEAAARVQQVELQRQDALERRVAWDADEGLCDEDAEGEDDPDCDIGAAGSKNGLLGPIGVRDDEGHIRPLSQEERRVLQEAVSTEQAQYAGRHDAVPARSRLNSPMSSPSPTPTPQPRHDVHPHTQSHPNLGSLPPSEMAPDSIQSESSIATNIQTIDTQLVKDLIMDARAHEDSEMLDLETQMMPPAATEEDFIQSFSSPSRDELQPGSRAVGQDNGDRDGALECECGIAEEDSDTCKCDVGCNRWFHTWCMGYHSATDERLPSYFRCFDCRVKTDKNWDLIVVHDLYPRMMAKFRDLAIMRRAIKIFETHNPETLSTFTKLLGCGTAVAGQLFKRLETEGFIVIETKELDELGLIETTTHITRKKGKGNVNPKKRQSHRRKPLQKPKYIFNVASTQSDAYRDYFNPDPEVEKRLLALSEMVGHASSNVHANDGNAPVARTAESQTQEETQFAVPPLETSDPNKQSGTTGELKRKIIEEDSAKSSKKIKISVGPAVDLGD